MTARRELDAQLEQSYAKMAQLMDQADRIWRRVTDRLRADRERGGHSA